MNSDERLAALGETYSADILAATETPASAKELSEALDIPIATCYRRIECLVEADLLEEEGREFSNRGRRTSVYRRTVDGVAIEFEEGEPRVRVTERADPRNVLGEARSNVER